MKQKISLASSTSFLIGVVIAILALLREPVQTVLLLLTFALWGLWVVLTLLRPSWRVNRDYRRREEREAREQNALSGKNLSGLLLTHVNYRVSDYLKRAYPDARWEWMMPNPVLFIAQGGTGRIRIYGVPDYEYADITLTITEMAAEIERQAAAKVDYLVNPQKLEMESLGGTPMLRVLEGGVDQMEPLSIQETAHRQLGTHLGIPWKYYERMLQKEPGLLSHNVNHWLHKGEPAQRMLRTLDGKARAFLSNRYWPIDNMEIATTVLPLIMEMQGARFESAQITENYMYIKVVNPKLTGEVRVGDIVQSGIVISNSETGLGAVNVQPLLFRLACLNGMVVNDSRVSTRRNHVGRANSADENFALYSKETLEADSKAFMMKLQDSVKAAVDEARFTKVLDVMRESTQAKLDTRNIPATCLISSIMPQRQLTGYLLGRRLSCLPTAPGIVRPER